MDLKLVIIVQAYLLVFFLMVLPAAGLYFAAQQLNLPLVWILLGLFISGNLLALLIPLR